MAKLFRGENYPSGGAQHGGIGTRTAFAHAGGDVGGENAWLAGVSMLKTHAPGRRGRIQRRQHAVHRRWHLEVGAARQHQGWRHHRCAANISSTDRDGAVRSIANDPALTTAAWDGQRRGAYLEGVYRLNRTWDVGYRYDRLWSDADDPIAAGAEQLRPVPPQRGTHLAQQRVQPRPPAAQPRQTQRDDSDNAVTVQYQTSLGAHGAHKF